MKCVCVCVCVCVYIYIFMYLFFGFKVMYFKTSGWSTQPQHVVYIKKLMKLCSCCRQYAYNFRYLTCAAILTADTTSLEECAFTAKLCRLLRSSCKVPDIFQILPKFGFSLPMFIKVPKSIVTEIRTMRAAPIWTDGRTDLAKLKGLSRLW